MDGLQILLPNPLDKEAIMDDIFERIRRGILRIIELEFESKSMGMFDEWDELIESFREDVKNLKREKN